MEIRPDYYDSFKCIADKCKHNCCIGWEIDIDEQTLEKYKRQSGALRNKLELYIDPKPCAHFVLTDNERCPFLNDKNLCELILGHGEDMLCQICRDHPRFFSDVYGITEKGLGLSCEAAVELILTKVSPFSLITDSAEIPQNDFYIQRNKIFGIIQNREKPLSDRITELLCFADTSLSLEFDWIKLYKGLERLDSNWEEYLSRESKIRTDIPNELEIPFEQLLCYFIYRHLSGGLEDFLFCERILFAVLSCYIITTLNKSNTLEEMLEIARMYSAEIEYSDQNIETILEELSK